MRPSVFIALVAIVGTGLFLRQGDAQQQRQQAQVQTNNAPQAYYPSYPAYNYGGGGGGGGYWGGGGYGGGATVGSSYAHGMADVVRSAGYANLMNSAAAMNWESAFSQDLNNRLQATNTYFELRRINRTDREEERGPKVTAEELTRYAKEAAPNRLTASQLDPVSGEIGWPRLLQNNLYAPYREKIDAMFASRESSSGAIGSVGYRQLYDEIEAMRAELVKHIKDYDVQNYLGARKFLDSLQYESRFVSS